MPKNNDPIGVSVEEYETLHVIAARISKSYDAIMTSEKSLLDTATATNESLQALIPVLQSIAEMKHEIVVQPSGVTVEAAKVMMPEMPAPVVQVIEPDEKPLTVDLVMVRKPNGEITIKGTIG